MNLTFNPLLGKPMREVFGACPHANRRTMYLLGVSSKAMVLVHAVRPARVPVCMLFGSSQVYCSG